MCVKTLKTSSIHCTELQVVVAIKVHNDLSNECVIIIMHGLLTLGAHAQGGWYFTYLHCLHVVVHVYMAPEQVGQDHFV